MVLQWLKQYKILNSILQLRYRCTRTFLFRKQNGLRLFCPLEKFHKTGSDSDQIFCFQFQAKNQHTVAHAVPRHQQDDVTKKIQRTEGHKQRWASPAQTGKAHQKTAYPQNVYSLAVPALPPPGRMPKAEVKYSTDIPKAVHKKSDGDISGPVLEVNEADIRDDSWRMNYMRTKPSTEKMYEMQAYLNEHPAGKEERSKNHITHLAYQAMKQQLAERYANVQESTKDGRAKYGW